MDWSGLPPHIKVRIVRLACNKFYSEQHFERHSQRPYYLPIATFPNVWDLRTQHTLCRSSRELYWLARYLGDVNPRLFPHHGFASVRELLARNEEYS